jgi:uncharacterized membrane protein YraQ (UPF0718 family)
MNKKLIAVFSILILWVVVYFNLANIANWFTYTLLQLPIGKLASTINFFIFEFPKVTLLLLIVVFIMGIVRSFFSPEKTRSILAGKNEFVGNILAALLGIVTPFCSCSAVPLFIGFVTSGVPLGVTFSFLVSAPMVNEVAVVLLFGLFGMKVAAIYLFTGLIIAIISGIVIGKLKLEHYVEAWVYKTSPVQNSTADGDIITFNNRIEFGFNEVNEIVGKVWPYILLGIAVGAGIHGYVPEDFMASLMGRSSWWSVPVSVLIGIPMYSNAAGIIPIVQALLEKGAALGTVLAFMMSVIGLSLPEAIILRKVLKPQLIAIFMGIVATGILIVGYLFNYIF